jgi:hypothetical protein
MTYVIWRRLVIVVMSSKVQVLDPLTGELSRLFNPRSDSWAEHFAWDADRTMVMGLSPIGRVTIVALRLNNADITSARALWIDFGWHPPQ